MHRSIIVVNIGNVVTLTPHQAVHKMRQMSESGIPFSFTFYSYDSTRRISSGIKHVEQALLRLGLRSDQSDKAYTLIAYYNYKENTNRFFNLPLLLEFNGIQIKP